MIVRYSWCQPAVRQLVDADVGQIFEAIGRAEPAHDTRHDVPHGRPGDPQHRRNGRLVGALRQVRRRLLELTGEPRPVLGPRDELGQDAAAPTVDAAQAVAQQHDHPPEVQVPPEPRSLVVHPRRPPAAPRAARRSGRRRHVDDQAGRGELEAEDASELQPEQDRE
jgi:hypothetical protein